MRLFLFIYPHLTSCAYFRLYTHTFRGVFIFVHITPHLTRCVHFCLHTRTERGVFIFVYLIYPPHWTRCVYLPGLWLQSAPSSWRSPLSCIYRGSGSPRTPSPVPSTVRSWMSSGSAVVSSFPGWCALPAGARGVSGEPGGIHRTSSRMSTRTRLQLLQLGTKQCNIIIWREKFRILL